MENLFEFLIFENCFDKNVDIKIETPLGSQPVDYQLDPQELKKISVNKIDIQSIKIFAKWSNDPDHNGRLLINLKCLDNYPQFYLKELTAKFYVPGSLQGEIKIAY